jgi:hypothetical protein|tara:strand:+ start:5848 stop:6255 length:408 start_codon:yes stop_codon:yes gene_type:complete
MPNEQKIIMNSLADKIILLIIGIEHTAFGLVGLFAPLTAASWVSFTLNEVNSYSEVRSHYSLFLVIGILALVSIYKTEFMRFTYKTYAIVFGSFLIGRTFSVFADAIPNTSLWLVILFEFLVVLVSLWRLKINAR